MPLTGTRAGAEVVVISPALPGGGKGLGGILSVCLGLGGILSVCLGPGRIFGLAAG